MMTITTETATTEAIDTVDDVEMYRVGTMNPFLMTIVSSTDLWMFLSNTGGLTAGRVSAEYSLFPYETDDRLHHLGGRVGPATAITISGSDAWEPFTAPATPSVEARRSLRKSLLTDAAVFEEHHPQHQLTMRYRWAPSDRFGWVRTTWVTNNGDNPIKFDVVDGLLGIMPWGINMTLQQQMSNLANAYRRSELIDDEIGVYTLESRISDLPQPAEAMKATVVWSTGLSEHVKRSVDPAMFNTARRGGSTGTGETTAPSLLTGRPGAYLLSDTITLAPGETRRWHIAADVSQDHLDIAELTALINSENDLAQLIDDDIAAGHQRMAHLIAAADGAQSTASAVLDAHHAANTLFNIMRGGTFLDGYTIDVDHLRAFVRNTNREVATQHDAWLESIGQSISVTDLIHKARDTNDPGLSRLAMEYLPLSFSRRHGDPSRPWNKFEIRVQDDDGNPVLSYQGNWRDIFQNWEALCHTFPEYLPSVIARFLNASTADGYNPYRVTSEGIDWEVPEPDNPWSGIGYWGDHQIVYLYRLLKTQEAHRPGWLADELAARHYAFADVPYRIAPYHSIVSNPKKTIEFDEAADREVQQRVNEIGADGRLIPDGNGGIVYVSMLEKLLIPALTKLSNYVPRGGIWMNTERPEWNDANNALVGYGLSMVTLCYLNRYLDFLADLTVDLADELPLSAGVVKWLADVTDALEHSVDMLDDETLGNADRARVVNKLGTAYDTYRTSLYAEGPSESAALSPGALNALFASARTHLRDAILHARRGDGLYDAYNLIGFSEDRSEVTVDHLQPMLEGQVAAISAGVLSTSDIADLVETLFSSALYREDVNSFVLYPATQRPPFIERNRVPSTAVANNPLLSAMVEVGDTSVVATAINGDYYFNGEFSNSTDLDMALEKLTTGEFSTLATTHRHEVLAIYEAVFHHHAFTGRSASMYAFEGLGSVYWHMVAKLLLAIQEAILDTDANDSAAIERLTGLYERVRSGLGFNKSALDYGAFPTDPYSHTPAHSGAQQPGMTGQVKEELLTRWAEVGVVVEDGRIHFSSRLVAASEFSPDQQRLSYVDVHGHDRHVDVPEGAIAFTLCRTPFVVCTDGDDVSATVHDAVGGKHRFDQWFLPNEWSSSIFTQDGSVTMVEVSLPRRHLGRT